MKVEVAAPQEGAAEVAWFVGALAKTLKKNWPEVKSTLNSEFSLQWEYFTPLASSKAGVIEICVKLFKDSLKKAMNFKYRGHKTPRYFNLSQFRIVCLECCSFVNERPLGQVTADKEGIVETINVSPNQLVFGRSKKTIPVNLKLKDVLEGGLSGTNLSLVIKEN